MSSITLLIDTISILSLSKNRYTSPDKNRWDFYFIISHMILNEHWVAIGDYLQWNFDLDKNTKIEVSIGEHEWLWHHWYSVQWKSWWSSSSLMINWWADSKLNAAKNALREIWNHLKSSDDKNKEKYIKNVITIGQLRDDKEIDDMFIAVQAEQSQPEEPVSDTFTVICSDPWPLKGLQKDKEYTVYETQEIKLPKTTQTLYRIGDNIRFNKERFTLVNK